MALCLNPFSEIAISAWVIKGQQPVHTSPKNLVARVIILLSSFCASKKSNILEGFINDKPIVECISYTKKYAVYHYRMVLWFHNISM